MLYATPPLTHMCFQAVSNPPTTWAPTQRSFELTEVMHGARDRLKNDKKSIYIEDQLWKNNIGCPPPVSKGSKGCVDSTDEL